MLEKDMPQTIVRETPKPRSTNLRALAMILVSVVFAGSGQLLFKAAVNEIGELQLSIDMFINMATNLYLWMGLTVFGISAFLWLIALMKAELSFAYPFLSLSYVIVLLGGALIFNEQITALRLVGFLVIITGLFIVANGEHNKA